MEYRVILFYKYVHIADPEAVAKRERETCEKLSLKGRCIIAAEGINATYEGTEENIKEYIQELEKDARFKNIHFKLSAGTGDAFPKLSVKVRKEIVSLGLTCDTCPAACREGAQRDCTCGGINPNEITGIHLKPEELHEWFTPSEVEGLKPPKEFYIVDMRNAYEHKVGHFENSILPPLENFRDLPKVVEQIKHLKNKTVLTVCTGGVRCEKASGFLITQGFTDVYQLDGGIVSYMEKYPNENFQGKLYVFDGRVVMTPFYTDDPKFTRRGGHQIVGTCDACKEQSENYVNCANPVCHRHFIVCENCLAKNNGEMLCPNGCTLSRHGRPVRQPIHSNFKDGGGKISPIQSNLIEF